MERHRPITEDDILLTEMLMARSYSNLKQSVVRTSFSALGSAGETIKKHPYATAGAALGTGIVLFMLFRLMTRSGSAGRPAAGGREGSSRPDMTMEILSMLMPVVSPYITACLEKYLGTTVPRDRR